MRYDKAEQQRIANMAINDYDSINSLGTEILSIMNGTPLQPISMYLLSQQSLDAGFEFNDVQEKDLPQLIENLKGILPRLMPVSIVDKVIKDIENVKEGASANVSYGNPSIAQV
ncbi:MAG: hypothetical protein KAX31_07235 [Thermoplasmata archaeon]|nr:hypothetical protein [Thermoplasmata archaeon]